MAVTASTKLTDIRQRVEDRIGSSRFRTWFGDVTEFRLNTDGLDVMVSNSFIGNWIAHNYMEDIVASAQDVLGENQRVDVRVVQGPSADGSDDRADGVPAAPAPKPGPARRGRGQRGPLRGKLEEYVVGDANSLAYSAATHLMRNPGSAFKLLVVHGGCGLGKTHLLQGICNGLRSLHPGLEWCYISGEEFTNEFIHAVKCGRVDLFRSRFRNVDVLVVDDIHFLAHKKATQEEFLHTYDAIDACGKSVVLSSDRHPRSIATLSEPLISRLIAGMVVEIKPPDFATRREILRQRAVRMNCAITDEVLDSLAQRISRNVRELEGALYKLAALASLMKKQINLELAAKVLEDHIVRSIRSPGAEQVVRLVADRFGVTRDQIHSKCRDRTVSTARAVALYLVRKYTQMSFPEIGRAIGGKNHSTVLMATQRIEKLLGEDATVKWRTGDGTHTALIRGLIAELEPELQTNQS